MRTGYFGYQIEHKTTREIFLVDIRRFLSSFITADALRFKQGLTYGGENLLLLNLAPSTYVFIQTRDQETAKRVHRRDWTADDLRHVLQRNESIGFASYVIMDSCWLGIGCRVLSPRITAFGHFVNAIFEKLNLPYRFSLVALQTSIAATEIGGIDRVGSIKIGMDAHVGMGRRVLDVITGGAAENQLDVAAIQIKLIPRRTSLSDLGPTLQSIVEGCPEGTLESLEARARLDALEKMTDVYIYGSGAIRDFVEFEHEHEIPGRMRELAANNPELDSKVDEYANDDDKIQGRSLTDLGINWARAYAGWLAIPE